MIDSYRVPATNDPGREKEWWVARHVDDDGSWTCRHKHETEEEAMGCARRFASSIPRRLAAIMREEAGNILATGREMLRERRSLIDWRPSKEDQARMAAVDAANHQLAYSLLSMADKLDPPPTLTPVSENRYSTR